MSDSLSRIPLFQHLSAHRLAGLRAQAKLQRAAKGSVIFRQGARADSVWVILEGWLHLVHEAASTPAAPQKPRPHAVVLFTITPTEVICGLSAIELGTYTASGVAGTASKLLRIPQQVFSDALIHEPDFTYHVLRLCAQRLRRMAEHYGSMDDSVSHRIIRSILRLQEQFGATLPMTHRELAQMSWTTTESAIRTVRSLKRQGLLTGTRGQLFVSQPVRLQRLLESNGGPSSV
ncbi:MAG: Crp/Fnr family transcriptional regulator [Candidatus Omnitrophica bacterium]|nr:Crp/Fnr family transcriptional regulator [Candidatus Omnitrophota bacterium]